MRHYKTEAIILDSTDIFEADRSHLLFTQAVGKVRARARGVRKPTSRLAGHLLPYLPTQLELIEGSGGLVVTQAQITGAYERESTYPQDSLLFLRQAAIVSEAVNRLFVDLDPHPAIYDGLVYTLDRLRFLANQEEGEERSRLVAAEFLLKALGELGYQAELDSCVVTGQRLEEEFVGWNSRLGGVISRAGHQQAREGSRILASPRTVVALRQLLKPVFLAERLQMGQEVVDELCAVVYDYLQTQLGQPLRSLRGSGASLDRLAVIG